MGTSVTPIGILLSPNPYLPFNSSNSSSFSFGFIAWVPSSPPSFLATIKPSAPRLTYMTFRASYTAMRLLIALWAALSRLSDLRKSAPVQLRYWGIPSRSCHTWKVGILIRVSLERANSYPPTNSSSFAMPKRGIFVPAGTTLTQFEGIDQKLSQYFHLGISLNVSAIAARIKALPVTSLKTWCIYTNSRHLCMLLGACNIALRRSAFCDRPLQ